MPRPALDPDAVHSWDVRITPPNQQRIPAIRFEKKSPELFPVLVVAEEGTPNGTPQLHYHIWLETKMSESYVRKFIKEQFLDLFDKDDDGNRVYSMRKPNEKSRQYIVKDKNIVFMRGWTQEHLEHYMSLSDDYRRNKDATRKRDERARDKDLMNVFKHVEKDLHERNVGQSPESIIQRILDICTAENIRYPVRTQMDYMVARLLYPHNPHRVVNYYAKSFSMN